ncbi:MAG TPA: HAMP domain-containing sensor histidine kinase [Oculatellaceae cyanobacterium]
MKAQFKFGLKFVHKLVLLITVPLVLNIAWLCLLGNAIQQLLNLVALERNQTAYIEHTSEVLDNAYEAKECFAGYCATKKHSYLERSDRCISQTENALHKLLAIDSLNKSQRKTAVELEEMLVSHLHQTRRILTVPQEQQGNLLPDLSSVNASIDMVLGSSSPFSTSIEHERSELENLRLHITKTGNEAINFVIAGFVLNICLSVLSILLVNADQSKRLNTLVENARNLPKNEPLQTVPGADELAYLDNALHQASASLVEAAAMRASLMQMVAHDMRSPLTSCKLSLDLIELEHEHLSPAVQKQLRSLKSNVDRLTGLTSDLLLIEQLENNQIQMTIEPDEVRDVTESAILSLNSAAINKNIQVRNEVDRCYAQLDRKRILQVLVNYLSNAIKFSPEGSVIVVTSVSNETTIKVSVQDKGAGVSKAEQALVFDKFFQTQNGKRAGGAGLGLTISKAIVNAHHGEVGVTSEPGSGSTFWFSLPLVQKL